MNTLNLFEDDCILSEQNDYILILLCHQSMWKVEISILTDSYSDAPIAIIDEVNTGDVVKIKDIETETPSSSLDTDFLMDQPDNGNKQNEEEILLHYEPLGCLFC